MFFSNRLTGARTPGLFLHKNRVGIVQPSMGSMVFLAIEPDGSFFIESLLHMPQKLGISWQSALSEACLNHFTEEKWRGDYNEFVSRIKEMVEDSLLDDEEDSELIQYDKSDDETRVLWKHNGVENRIHHLVKDEIVTLADWYTDDKGLDKGLEFMKAVPDIFQIGVAGVYTWTDYKRIVFLMILQRHVYMSILDRVLD